MLGVLLAFLLAPGLLEAVEFSADYVTRVNGKTKRAQIYVKEDRLRLEHRGGILTDLGYAGVSIFRVDKQTVWLLVSKRRQYLSLPLHKEQVPPLSETLDGETSRKMMGEEILGGHRATLYEVIVGAEPRIERYYQWVSMEHRLPLRILSRDRDWAVEYEHVVFSKQPDYFFEVPLGYAEWQPPALSPPPTEVN